MSYIRYFYSTIADGNMNCNPQFYPSGMTKEEIRNDFDKRRLLLGKKIGFDGFKILTAIQKFRPNLEKATKEEAKMLLDKYDSKYSDGHAVFITKSMIEGLSHIHN